MVVNTFHDEDCVRLLQVYTRQEQLGQGAQGAVYILRHRVSGAQFAGKMFASASQAEHEVRILHKLRSCPGVVAFETFVREEPGGRCYGTLVMELCSVSLFEELNVLGLRQMDERMAAVTVKRLAQALVSMHRRGVVHRDLKLENVFVRACANEASDVVIGDLGVACDDIRNMKKYCGTPPYMAPEVKNRSAAGYTEAVDTWGLGLIAYELLRGTQSGEHLDKLRSGASPDGVSGDALDFLQRMLAIDPANRMRLEDVAVHPWILFHCGKDRRGRGFKRPPPSNCDTAPLKKCSKVL